MRWPTAAAVKLFGSLLMIALGAALAAAAEPPQVFLDTTYVEPSGGIIPVGAGGDFQAALDQAEPGQVIEFEAGATFTGNFILPNKTGSGWVYIRSSAHTSLPPPGVRVTPFHADLMPKIVSPNTFPAIATAPGAHHYRFIGVEITTTHAATDSTNFNVILLEAAGGQTSLAQVPSDIVFDRSYIHGNPYGNVRRGIAMNSARTAVIDSHLSDFHEAEKDSQAILGWNGPGPFKIVNNYLEGAGENVMFGGGDPRIPDLVPSDIEIRHNHFSKPRSWNPGDPSFAGTAWAVKNLLELKNAQRVLIEGNIFEHNWVHRQSGFAVLFTVRNQDGTAPWSVVQDVTFTRNIVRHTASGIEVLGTDFNFPSQQTKRVLIKDNVLQLGDPVWGPGGRAFQLLDGTADLVIDHNTVFNTEKIIQADGPPHTGFIYRNNIAAHNLRGVAGDNTVSGNDTLNTYFPGAVFQRNILSSDNPLVPAFYPPDNFFPPSFDDVGFVNLAGGDFYLALTSPFKGAGTDGNDIGADIDAIDAATAGVINQPPDCRGAQPSPSLLWQPNHKFVPISVLGVTDADNDPVSIALTAVTQDEPVNGIDDGNTSPDAVIQGDTVEVRAERSEAGNGRVYQVHFTADDGRGGVCTGRVAVGVPYDASSGTDIPDDGQLYDSTVPEGGAWQRATGRRRSS